MACVVLPGGVHHVLVLKEEAHVGEVDSKSHIQDTHLAVH
jgi:hypothetical protein